MITANRLTKNSTFQFFEEHALDSVWINQSIHHQYLHIPINASCWGKTIFSKVGFDPGSMNTDFRTIIFFRDPIDRWLSGLSTWLTYRVPQHTNIEQVRGNQALLDVLFDTVRQDDHTERQQFFVQNVNWQHADCFFINSSFRSSVTQYFIDNYDRNISNVPAENQTTLEGGKLIPRQYFQSVLESNSTYMNRVKSFFNDDYKFLQSLKFLNTKQIKCRYYDF